jgi:peroxiredoxin Q/BCP
MIPETMKRSFCAMLFASLLVVLAFPARSAPRDEESGSERSVSVGSPAPDFILPDQTGTEYSLSQFKGKKNVVLYFYPKDDTPGCTKEACGFRDLSAVFDSVHTVILGVSVDDTDSHGRFARKYNLNFPILSDADKEVSKKYDALSFYGMSKRHTYVIDTQGIVRMLYTDVDVSKHSQEVARFIRDNLM